MIAYAARNDDALIYYDSQLLLDGEWVGAMAAYGPLEPEEYKLPTMQLPADVRQQARLWHLGAAYSLPGHRGGDVFVRLAHECFGFQEREAREAQRAYCLSRATVSAGGDYENRLVKHYEKHLGLVLTGWVAEATRRIANRATVSDWPAPEEGKEFYGNCHWGVMERLVAVGDEGAEVLTGAKVMASL